MSYLIIARPSDGYTITGGNSPAATPVGNLKTLQPGEVWRSAGLGSLYLEMDCGSARAVDTIALLFTNATAAATWRIRAADTQGGLVSSPPYDSGTLGLWASSGIEDARPHALLYLAAAVTRRWWRIDITDAANPAGAFEAGRLYLTRAWRPSRNASYGLERGFEDAGGEGRTYGGNIIPRDGIQIPTARFRLQWLARAEREADLEALNRQHGPHKDVLVVFDPEDATWRFNRMYYGLLKSESGIVEPAFRLYEQGFRLTGLV